VKNAEILKMAIEKAIKYGWKSRPLHFNEETHKIEVNPWKTAEWYLECGHFRRYYELIFTHDFAKAFWGNIEIDTATRKANGPIRMKRWQYHLQQMILEPEPLKYLKKFL